MFKIGRFFTDEFQLLGVSCLWVAVKFDESKTLKSKDHRFVKLTAKRNSLKWNRGF